jgi:hypothetical protein
MIIRTRYKKDLVDKTNIIPRKNIISWNSNIKDNSLPITELSWRFIWLLLKYKLKRKRIFMLFTPWIDKETFSFDFFYLKKK